MRVLTVAGTRPELIRLSILIKKLDELVNHKLIFTNQNYDYNLSGKFFDELKIRKPDYYFENKGCSIGSFLSNMLSEFENVLLKEKPDKVLILGDTNSGLCSIVCERLGYPVLHAEAGNRCFDKKVPEEINRKIIDSISSFNLPYTNLSKENLLHDGVPKNRIFVMGNPIYEVLNYYKEQIELSGVLRYLEIKPQKYFLATFHRSESVDNPDTLKQIIAGLGLLITEYKFPVICSIHPRTSDKIKKLDVKFNNSDLIFCEPFGFFDFVKLEKESLCVISDSGTVCEETCILRVPNVIIREVTERSEVLECGSSILAGTNSTNILRCVKTMINAELEWEIPKEYRIRDVSDRVIKIILGEHK